MTDDIYAKVGARIRSRRDRVGMTQASLATSAGLKRTSITNIEHGSQSIMLHQLLDVARALRADPREFIEGLDQDDPSDAAPAGGPAGGGASDLLGRLDRPVRGTTVRGGGR